MTSMTAEDRKAVADAPDRMLAEWWCLLNKWQWPRDGLGQPDPETHPWTANTRRGEIMAAIVERIGMRECLREWNAGTMARAEFDAWWAARHAA